MYIIHKEILLKIVQITAAQRHVLYISIPEKINEAIFHGCLRQKIIIFSCRFRVNITNNLNN
jgi:hypothetical protein